MMDRNSEVVAVGEVTIETYVDGSGPDVVLLPSYGRDGGGDFDPLTAALADAGFRVLRPQPRGIARSAGPMTGVTLDDQGTTSPAYWTNSAVDPRSSLATPTATRSRPRSTPPRSAPVIPACPRINGWPP
jgi:pimeloyl-ACP methyl ester carboxylesterase